MRPRQWAGTAQGWGLSKPTKGTPEHPPLMGGEGPVPCPGGTGPLITSFSSASQPLAQELGQATPRGDSWHTVGAQKMCPVPPFPPRTELGQALADCSPQQPPSCPAWPLPNRTLGRARCPSPPPPTMAVCSYHQLLQREPPWLRPRGAAAFLCGDRGPQPPCPAPALTGCSPAASQFPEPA